MENGDDAALECLRKGIAISVRSGFGRDRDVLREIAERIEDELGVPDAALARKLRDDARRLLERQREIESGWNLPTTNDAIDRAFADLDASGIVAACCTARPSWRDGWCPLGVRRD